MGVHVVAHKTAVFGLSAMLVGMAGGLSALSIKYVAPGLPNLFPQGIAGLASNAGEWLYRRLGRR